MFESDPAIKLAPLQFSLRERDRRYAAVRKLMAARGMAFLLIPHNTGDWDNFQPDLRYLTCIGGGGAAAALVFPIDGNPIVAVRETRRIPWWKASQNWVSDVRSPPQFLWSRFFVETLHELGAAKNAKIGIVGLKESLRDIEGTISFGEFTAVQHAFPDVSFECATDILYAVRKRKSSEEIGFVKKAQACADAVDLAFREIVRPGISEHEVYARMFSAHISAGGEASSMFLFSADKRFWQTQLMPTFRLLEQDDVLMVEAEPKYYGYMAQAVISASFRKLSDMERRLFDTSQECFDTLLSELVPGRNYKSLIDKWKTIAARNGVSAGRTMGHGLGLGQDGPLISPAGDAGGLEVEEGDVLVLKPWVCDLDDTMAIRVGGTVVVGPNATERLGCCSIEPHIVS